MSSRRNTRLPLFPYSGFRITDETNTHREYFSCSTRDEMAKWMNKMGLAAINFNIDDSKIAGFNKGFVDSVEGSPVTAQRLTSASPSASLSRSAPRTSSPGDSDNESDKESTASWQKSESQHSSVSDMDSFRDKNPADREQISSIPSGTIRHTRSASSTSNISLPETNKVPVKATSNRFVAHQNPGPARGHQRTCSSPIRWTNAYINEQENVYANAASKLSDSDSSSDCSGQRMFVNSAVLADYRAGEVR